MIFDADIWSGPGREYLIPANPTLVSNGGTLYAAADLPALAQQLGLPQAALQETIANYNAAVEGGRTEALAPRRTSATYKPWPIRKSPFHAVSCTPA